jgi:hypothetical protein
LGRQNQEYKELILNYEEQSRVKEQEWREVQTAIKDQVATLEELNSELTD